MVFIYIKVSGFLKNIKNSILKKGGNKNIPILSQECREFYRFKTSWGDEN